MEDLNAAIQCTVRYQTLRKETSRMQARLDRLLKNTVERAAILCGDGEVGAEDLGFDLVENSSIREISSMPAARVVDQVVQSLSEKQMNLPAVEKALIQEALRRTGGNQAHAAEILGISRMVLRNRMKRCGLL